MTPLLCACAVITLERQKCRKGAPRSVEFKGTLHPKIFSSPKAVNDRWNLSVWGRPSRKVKFLLCARSKSSETGRPAAFIRPQHTPDTPPQRHRSNVSQRPAVAIVTRVDRAFGIQWINVPRFESKVARACVFLHTLPSSLSFSSLVVRLLCYCFFFGRWLYRQ